MAKKASKKNAAKPAKSGKASLTMEQLLKAKHEDLGDIVLKFMWKHAGKGHPHAEWKKLPPVFRYFVATQGVEVEVFNGGFAQYFCNSTSELATDAIAGFKAMKLPKFAALTTKAVAIAKKNAALIAKVRKHDDDELSDEYYSKSKWAKLDDDFFRLCKNAPDFADVRNDFVKARMKDFVFPRK